MGMYTQFVLDVEIKDIEGIAVVSAAMTDVPRIGGSSYYFADPGKAYIDIDTGTGRPLYYLHVNCSLKNYDSDVDRFLAAIEPAVGEVSMAQGEAAMVGFTRYEEDRHPVLIYLGPGGFTQRRIED